MGRRFAWTDKTLALLGSGSDRRVGEQLGISEQTVMSQRRRLGIPPFDATRSEKNTWDKPENVALLGTASDEDIAAKLGLSHATVQQARIRRGIPSFTGWEPGSRGKINWTEETLALLGNIPDSEIARMLGVSTPAIHWKRKKLGIARAPSGARPVPSLLK